MLTDNHQKPKLILSTVIKIFQPFPRVWCLVRVALLVSLIASSTAMGSILLFKLVINQFLVGIGYYREACQWLFCYLLLYISGRFFADYAFWLYSKFDQAAQKALGHYVFQRLQSLSWFVYLEQPSGHVAHIIDHGFSGFRNLFYLLFTGTIPLLIDLVIACGVLYYYYGLTIALITLMFISVFAGLTCLASRKIEAEQQTWMGYARQAFGRCFDSLVNYEAIKYFGNEAMVARRFHQDLNQLEAAVQKAVTSSTRLNHLQTLLIGLFMASLLSILGSQIAQRQLLVADLVMVNLYLLQIMRPLNFLGQQLKSLKIAYHEINELFSLLAQPTEPTEQLDKPILQKINQIEWKQVYFSYSNGVQIFENFNLHLQAGERVAIVGASGAGKSTLTRLLLRLYEIDQGSILINGQDCTHYRLSSLRQRFSIVPQEVVLFNDTLLYNIQFGNFQASLAAIDHACQHAGIYEFIQSLPDQYQTVVGERGLKLSGGERQRIGIARAMLRDPDCYIFDEATSALDTPTERAIQQQIFSIGRQKLLLIIAHRLSTVIGCDRIIVMQAGEIIEQGNHQSLMEKKGYYAALWRAQQASTTPLPTRYSEEPDWVTELPN